MARTGRTRRLLIGGIAIVVLALCGFFLRGVRTPKQDVNEVHVSAGFEYIAAPQNFKWRQFEGITLDFVVENNINANILTRESGEFTNVTGIHVNVRPMDYDSFIERTSIDFISQTSRYELIYVDPYQTLNRFYNALEDLNRFINDPTLPQIDGWPHDFYQDQVDVISHFLDRDTVYAIPFDTPTMILFYRKDIFDKYRAAFQAEHGYDWTPGTRDFTWERYIEVAKWIDANVPDEEVKYGSGFMAQNHNALYCGFSNVMAAYGADYFYDADVSSLGLEKAVEVGVTSPEFIKSLEIYKRVIQASAPDSLEWDWVDLAEAFKRGEIAMMPNWDENWAAIENGELSKVAGKVGYSILPYGDVRSANIYGGAGIGISKFATEEQKKAAWLFIVWMASRDIQLVILNAPEGGNIPPRKSVCEDEEIRKATNALQMEVVLSAWEEDKVYFRPKTANFVHVERIIKDTLYDMLRNDLTPEATAYALAGQIDTLE